jgi:kynurenine formamidase
MTDSPTRASTQDPTALLRVLAIPTRGWVYDLDAGRFAGMPLWEGHPPWQLIGYRSPQGLRVQGDQEWLAEDVNRAGIGIMSDLLIAGMHSGAHIDALAHITCGDDAHWYGGDSAADNLGDFGPLTHDASTIPPIIRRGVLVDLAGSLGLERLPAHHAAGLEEVQAALDRQGSTIEAGDVVLFRTGQMSLWHDREAWAQNTGAGITLEVADWLIEQDVIAVGGDTETVEVMPSITPGNPHPVHARLLVDQGVHLMECLYLEQLASDRVYEFLYLALAPRIVGATAALIRPVAVA